MRAILVVVIAVGAVLATSAAVRADGCFFVEIAESKQMVASPRQEALMVVGEGTVTVTLRTHFRKGPKELAWIVPVPSEPTEVAKGGDAVFAALDEATAPRFLMGSSGGGFGCGCMGQPAGAVVAEAVTVKKSGTAGIFDWTVLSATDTDALVAWLTENRYAVPAGAERVFSQYVGKGWHWLAVKVRPEVADEPTLAPHPIVYTYKADDLVYPLAISQLSADLENEIVLYVLGPSRVTCANWANQVLDDFEVRRAPDSDGAVGTTYETVFRRATDGDGGHLFVTEFAQELDTFADYTPGGALYRGKDLLRLMTGRDPSDKDLRAATLTRLRAVMTPKSMDRDVVLTSGGWGDVRNIRHIAASGGRGGLPAWAVVAAALCALAAGRALLTTRRPPRWHAVGAAMVLAACLAMAML